MNKVIKHGLQIRAGLDDASRKEIRASLHEIFTEGSHIDFNTSDNLQALKSFAELFRDVFAQAGKEFDFSKIIQLPGPEMFKELTAAAQEFASAWDSVAGKSFGDRIINSNKEMMTSLKSEQNALKDELNLLKKKDEALRRMHALSRQTTDLGVAKITNADREKDGKHIAQKDFHNYQWKDKTNVDSMEAEVRQVELKVKNAMSDIENIMLEASNIKEVDTKVLSQKTLEIAEFLTILKNMETSFGGLEASTAADLKKKLLASTGNKYYSENIAELTTFSDKFQDKYAKYYSVEDLFPAMLKKNGVDYASEYATPAKLSENINAKSARYDEVTAELKELEIQANSTVKSVDEVNAAIAKRYQEGKRKPIAQAEVTRADKISKGHVDSGATLSSLSDSYNNAVANGDFVEQYEALLQFTTLYKKLEAEGQNVQKYGELFGQLSPYIDTAKASLDAFVNKANEINASKANAKTFKEQFAGNISSSDVERRAKEAEAEAERLRQELAKKTGSNKPVTPEGAVDVEPRAREEAEKAALAAKQEAEAKERVLNVVKQIIGVQKSNRDVETSTYYNSLTGAFDKIIPGDKNSTAPYTVEDLKHASANYDTRIHSHNFDVAAPTAGSDLPNWVDGFDYMKKQMIKANTEILSFDFSSLSKEALKTITSLYEKSAAQIKAEFDGYITNQQVGEKFGTMTNMEEAMQVRLRASLESIMQDYPGVMKSIPLPQSHVLDNAKNTSNVHVENANAKNAEAQAQEKLNAAEAQNPPAQSDAEVHNANADVIKAEAQAQTQLNVIENQNPPAQNEAPVHNENANSINNEEAATSRLAKARKAVRDFFGGSKKFTMSNASASTQEGVAKVVQTTGGAAGNNVDTSAELTGLRTAIETLTTAIKAKPAETNADTTEKGFDVEALKGVLTSITYNAKIVSEMSEAPAQQTDVQGKEPWALESTLNTTIKGVLDQIQTNTAQKVDKDSQDTQSTVGTEILTAIKNIETKLAEGIVYRGDGKKPSEDAPEKKKEDKKVDEARRKELTDELDGIKGDSLDASELESQLAKRKEIYNSLKKEKLLTDEINTKYNETNKEIEKKISGLKQWDKEQEEINSKSEALKTQYEQLGKLEAQRNMKPEGQRAALDVEIQKLEEVLATKRQELGIDDKLYDPARIAAYNAELEKLKAKEADAAYKEDIKTSKKNFNLEVQKSRGEAKLTQANSTSNTAEKIIGDTMSIDGVTPENLARLKEYQEAANKLNSTYNNLKYSSEGVITPEQAENIKAQTNGVRQLNTEFKALLQQHERLSGDNAEIVGKNQLGNTASWEQYKQQLTEVAMAATNGRAKIGDFDAKTGELTATVELGNHEVANYTFAMDKLTGSLVKVNHGTTKLATPIQQITKKIKELSYYFTGSMMIYRVIGAVRQGITYVKEIDSALTELKKVTDETEESYDKFLNTAAKTADKVGSTITNIVSSTADWARLNI